ncbi:gliding motility-associated C-terminal domain-containing protein [uncultured Roseivirga sp.]|uniref:T9SS type B sorting domain-containing protein n=1 Tax=uncultured Roseivirga sp. TaxID=543088 RepID=UPI0030D95E4F
MLFIAASANAQVTTEGRDFWFGFMPNNDSSSPSSLEVFVTSKKVAQVQLYIYEDDRVVTFTVKPGVTHKELISRSTNNPYAATISEQNQRKAIHIVSDESISVYAFNNRSASADASIILPTPSLGNKYYASTYFETPPSNDAIGTDNSSSQILIVASADATRLRVTPSFRTLDNKDAGVPYSIELNQGDVYLIQAQGDLTGTLIESEDTSDNCNNFAVFGGNVWTRVTGGENCSALSRGDLWSGGYAGDHLFEQMYPVSTWGKNYAALDLEMRSGYVLQITASEPSTRVSVNGRNYNITEAGDFLRLLFPNQVALITSDKPIQVAQLAQSLSCDFPSGTSNPNGPGDPFMIMISPIEQRLKEITFPALEATAINRYFVGLITDSEGVSNLRINDNLVPSSSFTNIQNSSLYYATVSIDKGADYNLKSDEGFVAYVYGFGQIESFGYVAGASLENLNAQLLLADATLNIIADEGCLNSDIDFKIQFETIPGEDPLYTVFDWHFDDGAMATGEEVNHTYTTPGDYVIRVIASNGEGSCGNSEVFTKQISILEVEASEIMGPQSVCPNVQNIDYSIEGADGNTYEWIISADGQITSGQGTNQVKVAWGAPNDNAFLKVVPRNALGCIGETLEIPVKINKELTPPLPTGAAEVCFDDYQEVTYSTLQTNGSVYTWEVIGGTFVNGVNTGNEVKVKWNGVGTDRKIRFKESNPLVADCDGYSDYLPVIVYSEIKPAANITNISCFGLTNGAIELTVTGGKPGDYTASWDNGMVGLSISGLKAGNYEATITDAAGCEVVKTYTITEPTPLTVTDGSILPVRCFSETNGSIALNITGGTPNAQGKYSIKVVGVNFDKTYSEPVITNLPAGGYAITVTDANGCKVSRSYTINEPPALEPFLESFLNLPICPQATNGTTYIEAKGGTPDYQFYWSNKPNIDSQEGSDFSQGAYSLTIRDASGCETVMDFDVEERFPKIFIPNAFSPNNDGVNDEFKPVTDCNLQYSIQIFNKWGEIVFSTEDITEGWDGRYKGTKVQDGQYSYIIFYAGALNGVSFEETRRGSLKLFR